MQIKRNNNNNKKIDRTRQNDVPKSNLHNSFNYNIVNKNDELNNIDIKEKNKSLQKINNKTTKNFQKSNFYKNKNGSNSIQNNNKNINNNNNNKEDQIREKRKNFVKKNTLNNNDNKNEENINIKNNWNEQKKNIEKFEKKLENNKKNDDYNNISKSSIEENKYNYLYNNNIKKEEKILNNGNNFYNINNTKDNKIFKSNYFNDNNKNNLNINNKQNENQINFQQNKNDNLLNPHKNQTQKDKKTIDNQIDNNYYYNKYGMNLENNVNKNINKNNQINNINEQEKLLNLQQSKNQKIGPNTNSQNTLSKTIYSPPQQNFDKGNIFKSIEENNLSKNKEILNQTSSERKNAFNSNSITSSTRSTITTNSNNNNNITSSSISSTTKTNSTPIEISINKKISQETKNIIETKIGLTNLGNTCYMNTCLQTLIHSGPFIEKLIKNKDSIPNSSISKEFYKICQSFENSSSTTSKYSNSFKPIDFKNAFAKKHSEFRRAQHDSQEFCRLLLEEISQELNTVSGIPKYKELNDKGKSKLQLFKDYDKLYKDRENSIVVDTFYGQNINIFQCNCGYESYSFDKFLDIPLIFSDSSHVTKLTDLLDMNYEDSELDWETKCDSCKKKQTHKKFMKICLFPEILIISLQRIGDSSSYFNNRRNKNRGKIQFDDFLDMSKYSDKECVHNQKTKYKLIGIMNHSGSLDFGHYYAYIKINDKWFEFNDDICSKIEMNYNSSTAYVFLYQKEE